uniref:Solute carrier family 35 member F1 n=1 Tax=Felis catus TaxID=9685 RepID=A0ABI7XJS2_FELCA
MIPPEPPQQQLQPPPPAPPNHVVTTIENLPAEGSGGGGGGGSLSASSRAGVRQRIRKVLNREMLISVALGQVLSLLICGIGLTSKYLSEDFHANTPVFQSFLNYILLFLVYTTTLAVRQGEENLLAILRRRWWKYMILGLIDLEANYLVVKAYQYTTLTSIQLLDCFVIPVVILLSWFFLLIRYKAVHFLGIFVCILGMGCMAGADVLVGRHQGAGENKLVGDLLVLGGATLYGISNVWEEYIIRTLSRVEFLGMIGLFGAFFSGIQLAIMEHKELLKVPWDWQIVFRTVSPVLLHHPHRADALLLHLHVHSPGPPSVQAVPQSLGTRCGLTNHSSGGAFGHLHQPGPGDRRGAPRSRGLGCGPPCPLRSTQRPCVRPPSLYCT